MTNPNGVAIKDIPGALVDKKDENDPRFIFEGETSINLMALAQGYNQALTEQGNVRISLNREKLADLIYKKFGNLLIGSDIITLSDTNYGIRIADAIISNQHNLLEASK